MQGIRLQQQQQQTEKKPKTTTQLMEILRSKKQQQQTPTSKQTNNKQPTNKKPAKNGKKPTTETTSQPPTDIRKFLARKKSELGARASANSPIIPTPVRDNNIYPCNEQTSARSEVDPGGRIAKPSDVTQLLGEEYARTSTIGYKPQH